MSGWVKAWCERAVEEDDGRGGARRTNRARRQRKGTPQGAPLSPLLSNRYLRRFLLGWKGSGYARRFGPVPAEAGGIVHYADDLVILRKESAATMQEAGEPGSRRDGPARDPAAASVAVSQAQGTNGEIRALPGQAPVE